MNTALTLEGCDILATTDDAILVDYENEEFWLPKSHVCNDNVDEWDWLPNVYDETKETNVDIIISPWLARKLGLSK